MIYLQLFWEYFKVGLFSVGGGLATLPFLTRLAAKTGWFTVEQLANMVAVAESTPGPIGVNMATYVGYTLKGVPGSLVATIGLTTPAIVIIIIIDRFLQKFKTNKIVESSFYGIRPASVALMTSALISLMRMCLINENAYKVSGVFAELFNFKYIMLFAVIMVLSNVGKLKKLHPLAFIGFAAVVGIVFRFAGV